MRLPMITTLLIMSSCGHREWKGKGEDYAPYGAQCDASFSKVTTYLDSTEKSMAQKGGTFTPAGSGYKFVGGDIATLKREIQDYLLWSDLVRLHKNEPRVAELSAKREALIAREDLVTFQFKGWRACQ